MTTPPTVFRHPGPSRPGQCWPLARLRRDAIPAQSLRAPDLMDWGSGSSSPTSGFQCPPDPLVGDGPAPI